MTNNNIEEIKIRGVFCSVTECEYAEIEEVVTDILAAEKRSDIDILAEILNDRAENWDKAGQFQFEHFVEVLFHSDLDFSPKKLIDACLKILNAPNFDRDSSIIPYCLGIYLGLHSAKSVICAEIVLNDIQYEYLVPKVLPTAILQDCDTWMPRLFSYIENAASSFQKACGFVALSYIDGKFVENCDAANSVYDFLEKFVGTPPYENFAVPLYKACVTWSSNLKVAPQFNDLRDELIKSKDKRIVNIVALLEQDEISSIMEKSLNVRISTFSLLLMNGKDYVDTIDGYFKNVYAIYPEKLLSALEEVLTKGDGYIYKDGYLDETFKTIALGSASLKDRIITRWLASDKPELWCAVQKVVRSARRNDDLGIRICAEELPDDDVGRINVMRRAVGRMFESYVTCIGYVVSCLKYLSDDAINFVEPMFYTVLTLNFPDIVRKATESLAKDNNADPRVIAFLTAEMSQWNKLDAALEGLEEIHELETPIKHRIEFWRMESKKHRDLRSRINKDSFLSLFPPLPVLYGNGTIYQQYTEKGENRVASPFSKFETSVRLPSMLRFGEMVLQKELDDLKYLPVAKQ